MSIGIKYLYLQDRLLETFRPLYCSVTLLTIIVLNRVETSFPPFWLQLEIIPSQLLMSTTDLLHLDVSNNDLDALPPQLRRLTNLQYLNLNHNPLSHFQIRPLPSLTDLRTLHMRFAFAFCVRECLVLIPIVFQEYSTQSDQHTNWSWSVGEPRWCRSLGEPADKDSRWVVDSTKPQAIEPWVESGTWRNWFHHLRSSISVTFNTGRPRAYEIL